MRERGPNHYDALKQTDERARSEAEQQKREPNSYGALKQAHQQVVAQPQQPERAAPDKTSAKGTKRAARRFRIRPLKVSGGLPV
jgi:hypothetical protein